LVCRYAKRGVAAARAPKPLEAPDETCAHERQLATSAVAAFTLDVKPLQSPGAFLAALAACA
jgi:hypothetical protein